MRIIGGVASGIEIRVPKNGSVRPSSASARKALFDSIANFRGLLVADLFAGSGGLGIEAASRGAAGLIFIEELRANCEVIRENCEKAKKAGAVFDLTIICSDLKRYFRSHASIPPPDIVFADPPYSESLDLMLELLKNANFAEWTRKALLVWESPDDKSPQIAQVHERGWKKLCIRKFGGKNFIFFSQQDSLMLEGGEK